MAEGQHTGRRIRRKDSQGYYVLGELMGDGGEGEIYAVSNAPERAAKIYKPDRDDNAKKLPTMERMIPAFDGEITGHPHLAWPEQVIQDRKKNLPAGFTMPRVNTNRTMTIGQFFIPSVRRQKLQAMNLMLDGIQIQQTKWNIIKNLSKTVAWVHEQGHLIGDINERNILVDPERGNVSIVDCDSFQIRDQTNRTIYRCRVGRPEYTAPELLRQMGSKCNIRQCPGGPDRHEMGYPCVNRNQEHDKFGIAVVVFQLLMDGSHPYDCRIDEGHAPDASTRQEKIKRGFYPYSRSKPPFIHINNRDNVRRYSRLPDSVKDLFERAFVRA